MRAREWSPVVDNLGAPVVQRRRRRRSHRPPLEADYLPQRLDEVLEEVAQLA